MKSRLIKISKYRVLFMLLSVLCMITIFIFSTENSDDSSETSGRFVKIVTAIFYPDFSEYTVSKQTEILDNLQFIIRKLAHFSIYTALGTCLSLSCGTHTFFSSKTLISLAGGILYAVSDEIHQYFVPGRSCELRDVTIDTGGVFTGLLISLIIIKIYLKIKKRHEKNTSDE